MSADPSILSAKTRKRNAARDRMAHREARRLKRISVTLKEERRLILDKILQNALMTPNEIRKGMGY